MALKKITVWRVTIRGEATFQAATGDDALVEAKKHFKHLADDIAWTLEQSSVYVEQPELVP